MPGHLAVIKSLSRPNRSFSELFFTFCGYPRRRLRRRRFTGRELTRREERNLLLQSGDGMYHGTTHTYTARAVTFRHAISPARACTRLPA